MEYRIIIDGDNNVGRKAIHVRYRCDTFNNNEDPRNFDVSWQNVEVDGERCMIDLWNTSFLDNRNSMYDYNYGFLLVFSVTSRSSFDKIVSLKEEIIKRRKTSFPPVFVIAGNKIDLEHERQVSLIECQELASSLNCSYFDISAKTGYNVSSALHQICREIKQMHLAHPNIQNKDSSCRLL